MRDRVRSQLHTAADDPDLPEVFDFLISNGVGSNTYIDDFQQWAQAFVDSKKRQMRFSAFAVVNKMCENCPLSKVAVLKRSYRKPPVSGFVPNPEPGWGDCKWQHLRILEELLRFFHAACKDDVVKMEVKSQVKFWGNVDTAAAEVFWNAKTNKMKYAEPKIQELMLEGTKKYFDQLELDGDTERSSVADWITWKKHDTPAVVAEAKTLEAAPKVVTFSEASGAMTNRQVSFSAPSQQETGQPQTLPWREWYQGTGSQMSENTADKAALVAVLQGLHKSYPVDGEPVDVMQLAGRNFVIATRPVKAETILLPPCVPKQSLVLERSEHPLAIKMMVVTRVRGIEKAKDQTEPATNGDAAASQPMPQSRERTSFFVNPEFKGPTKNKADAAVAEADGESQPDWVWGPPGTETMHPFWAVRRMNAKQLAKEAVDAKLTKMKPRFNCGLVTLTVTNVTVGVVKGSDLRGDTAINSTKCCEVPFLTNTQDLEEGEELILEVQEKANVFKPPPRSNLKLVFGLVWPPLFRNCGNFVTRNHHATD